MTVMEIFGWFAAQVVGMTIGCLIARWIYDEWDRRH